MSNGHERNWTRMFFDGRVVGKTPDSRESYEQGMVESQSKSPKTVPVKFVGEELFLQSAGKSVLKRAFLQNQKFGGDDRLLSHEHRGGQVDHDSGTKILPLVKLND